MKLQFNSTYLKLALLFFIIEIIIAQTTGFVRHTIGDYIVVMLLYTLLRSFIKTSTNTMCIITLFIAYAVETLQLTNFLEFFNLKNSYTANIIFGNTFSITDLVAYTLGVATILYTEFLIKNRKNEIIE